jgi:HSP20 family protein
MLTVRGEKRSERAEQDKGKNCHLVKRSYGSYSRAIPLPFDPDPAQVEAKFEKGALHIRLPSRRRWRRSRKSSRSWYYLATPV